MSERAFTPSSPEEGPQHIIDRLIALQEAAKVRDLLPEEQTELDQLKSNIDSLVQEGIIIETNGESEEGGGE